MGSRKRNISNKFDLRVIQYKMKKYSHVTLLGISFLLSSQLFGQAATNEISATETTVPEIIVTATRDQQLTKDTPYSTSVINSDEFQLNIPARTVPEILKNAPSVMVQKTGNGQGSPYIRGFTGYRNLFLIDGIRLNNSTFRSGPNQYWNTIDSLSLSRIELVRGPFSTLYGSDAIGGTVNAITRSVKDLRPDSNWDRRLYYRYSSAENSQIIRGESIGRLTDNLALTLGYSYKDFGDVEGGKNVGKQEKTGYLERDWDAKLEYFINDDSYLVLAHQTVNIDDAWRTHKTIYGIDWKGLSVGKELFRILDQDRNLTYLQYHKYNNSGFVEEIHAGISRHAQSEERDRLRTEGRHDVQGTDTDTLGAFVSFKSTSPIGTLVYGTEFYHDNVNSFNNKLNNDGYVKSSAIQGPVGDDATYDTLGIYFQDTILLAERLSLILGGRYEFAQADANSVIDPLTGNKMSVNGNWDDFVGSARMLYSLDDEKTWNLFAGISQGFRAPNLSDLTRLDSARTDEIETPSPNLKPENFMSSEIGVKGNLQGISLQLAYFYTIVDGMIVRTPTGRTIDGDYEVTKRNGGDGYIQGIEFDGRYRFWQDFTMFGTFTWIDGKTDTYPTSDAELSREYIDRLMPPTGRAGLRWDHNRKYWLEGLCTIAAKADKLSSRDKADTSRIPPGGTPGYRVYDIRSGWNVSENFTLSLSIENITDEDYRIHGSGLNEPGRNIVLAMETTF